MTNEKVKEFQEKMKALVSEYGLREAAFIGTADDDKFCAFPVSETKKLSEIMGLALNAGRWYQHMRNFVRNMFDDFEKNQ